jgi:hypothetical protein
MNWFLIDRERAKLTVGAGAVLGARVSSGPTGSTVDREHARPGFHHKPSTGAKTPIRKPGKTRILMARSRRSTQQQFRL